MSINRALLIDGDIIAYQQCASIETPTHWGNDLWTLHCDFKKARASIDDVLNGFMEKLEADSCMIALSDHQNYRKEIYPAYKENRKKTRKPVCYGEAREHLIYTKNAKIYSKLEADDVLGVWATSKPVGKEEVEKIIVSVDKDFKTIPCNLYNPNEDSLGIQKIPEGLADYWFMYQTLIGDSTDGYPGCPTIGPKGAEKIIGSPREIDLGELWPLVVATYEKKGLGESQATIQAQLARILRSCDYNKKNQKIMLWSPQQLTEKQPQASLQMN